MDGTKKRLADWHPDVVWRALLGWYRRYESHPDANARSGTDEDANLSWAVHRALAAHDVPAAPVGNSDEEWSRLAIHALRDTYGPSLTVNEDVFVRREVARIVDDVCRMRRGRKGGRR